MKKIIYLVSVLTVVFFACSKERLHPTKNLNEYASLDPYLKSKGVLEQEFNITEEEDSPIEGNQGTKVWLPKNILMFPDGEDVDYPYRVKLLELYKPKDMIAWQMPTVAQGDILETDGTIRVRAFKADENGNEQELVLKSESTFLVQMPSDSVRADMKVFYGFVSNGRPDWTSEKEEVGANEEADLYFDDLSTSYRARIGKLGWINCGQPHQGFYKLSFSSELDDLSNVKIFCFLENYQTVILAYNQETCRMPDSSSAKIMAMAIDGDSQLYCQCMSSIVTHAANVPISLQTVSDAQLTAVLDSL